MSNLSKEVLDRIERNRLLALQRRNAARMLEPLHSDSYRSPSTNQPPQASLPQARPPGYQTKNSASRLPSLPLSANVVKSASRPVEPRKVVFKVWSEDRFVVEMSYHEPSINIMKTIPGRVYDSNKKIWTFPFGMHDTLSSKLSALKPEISIAVLPKNIVNAFKVPSIDPKQVDILKIDQELRKTLFPFQEEGVKFGVSRNGRCLIADDMGLGKTVQALGIAHFYVESWPLLIVCPSSMRFSWEESILRFLPSVNPFSVVVLTTGSDDFHEARVVVSSYDLLKTCLEGFKRKKFGVIIYDESHRLKTKDSARTKAAMELSLQVLHLILLSGTPALSRPKELFPQIRIIDPTCFRSFHDFGVRYCDAKMTRFGYDYSGSSNTTELEFLLKKKFMLRRMKSEVLQQLPSKMRKVVVLPKMPNPVTRAMETLASKLKGQKFDGAFMQYYSATGVAKLPAVKEYIEDKLTESTGKMLIFAHHVEVLNGLEEFMVQKRIGYIRIDGKTHPEKRLTLCDQFQNDPTTRVALLSMLAANTGITLTAAQLVVFAELTWNPGDLIQAEDRAHRIGQQDSVLVEYLVAKGTVDDKIWTLIESKLTVLNAVGLSKDTFRNANTEDLEITQQTIPEMISKQETQKNVETGREEPSSTVVAPTTPSAPASEADFWSSQGELLLEEGFDFVEAESCSDKKRPRLDDAKS